MREDRRCSAHRANRKGERQVRSVPAASAIRISFGIASNFADAERFLAFAESFRDQTRLTMGEVTFDIESCRIVRDGS